VRWEVSHLEHSTASAAVICGRGSSNWENVSHRLKAVAHLKGGLTHALSVRLFYNVTTTAGGGRRIFHKMDRIISDFDSRAPPDPESFSFEQSGDYTCSLPLYPNAGSEKLGLCIMYSQCMKTFIELRYQAGLRYLRSRQRACNDIRWAIESR
jgi:hypothetical protein